MSDQAGTLFRSTSGELTTKERILDIAIDLMSAKGFDSVSIREIARAVGIRESSIYNHFKSKDEILDTIIDYFTFELTRAGDMDEDIGSLLEAAGPTEFIMAASKAYIQRINSPRLGKIWRIISIELYRNQKIRDFFTYTMLKLPLDNWENTFGQMIEKKLIKPLDTRVLAREFFSFAIYLYFVQFFIKYDDNSCAFGDEALKELDEHVTFFMEAIKA